MARAGGDLADRADQVGVPTRQTVVRPPRSSAHSSAIDFTSRYWLIVNR